MEQPQGKVVQCRAIIASHCTIMALCHAVFDMIFCRQSLQEDFKLFKMEKFFAQRSNFLQQSLKNGAVPP